ncbi:MAG: OmpH family outer membrane protein [Phycisphaerae bacterium]|nr:OmpH family outer membrane protein [Phycisphaerae bacterium]
MSRTPARLIAPDRLIAIAALVLAAASFLMNSRPQGAVASPITANDLGPADALILNDAKPKKADGPTSVKVRAEGGRVAWSEQPTARAWAFGVVHVDKVMKAILATPSFVEKREEMERDAKKDDEAFGKRLQELQAKYPNLTPQSPDAETAQREFTALREEYNKWREGAVRLSEKFLAEQVEAAYRQLLNAVEIVSDREGIDVVLRTLAPNESFDAKTFIEARDNVVGRVLLRYPDSLDLTDAVMKELSLPQ